MSEAWVRHVSHEWILSRIWMIVRGTSISSRAQSIWLMSNMSEAWVCHVSHEWVMSRIWMIVSGKPFSNRARSVWVSHMRHELYETWLTHIACWADSIRLVLHMYAYCRTWINSCMCITHDSFVCDVTHSCVFVLRWGVCWETNAIATFERVVSPRIRHVTYDWVTSRMNESRHAWWVTSHMQKSFHTWVCHVTYECVILLMNEFVCK